MLHLRDGSALVAASHGTQNGRVGDLARRLRTEWRSDLTPFHCRRADADEAFDELVARYREPHRRYHNLEHVASVRRWVDALARDLPDQLDLTSTRLAAWYHDFVHEPGAPDNEARSARHAAVALTSLHVPNARIRECARLIELTATHDVDESDTEGAVLVDADLAVLGSVPQRYDEYRARIRAEYEDVPEDEFRAGRAEVLRAFLGRPTVFATECFRAERERRARANLERELAELDERPR